MKTLTALLVALCVLCGQAQAAESKAPRPNIVVILADDFGWGSLGCYGGPADLKTPNLDRLAREGRRFTHAYAPGSVCSPTRYGLMTGRYYWRTSVKDGEVLGGGMPLHIETNRLTLASLCKGQGYATAAVGKWHLGMGSGQLAGRDADWGGVLRPGPRDVGFDYFFGMGSNPWTGPHQFIENDRVLEHIPGQPVVISRGEGGTTSGLTRQWEENQITKTVTGKAVTWLEQHRAQPFFLYFAPNAVHEPVAPNPSFNGSRYGKYGDFIQELDASVGQVLAALDRLKLTDNTLVIFTSDNGGVVNRARPSISAALDAGLAINGPLRGGKHDIWEGGFREAFLARWPGHVPAGTVSEQVLCLTDVLATLAHVLDVPLPKGSAEDSFDVLRAWTEARPGPPVRDHVVLQAADATYALRQGDWKLIERVDAPKVTYRNQQRAERAERTKKAAPHDELFNLKADPAEAKDAYAANVELAAKLKQRLREARDRGFTRPGAGP
jgi:arylsulfatase A-like enzyme